MLHTARLQDGRWRYLRVVMSLVGGRVCTKEVIVTLVINVPNKAALSFVEDHRYGCIVVGPILVLSLNELQRN